MSEKGVQFHNNVAQGDKTGSHAEIHGTRMEAHGHFSDKHDEHAHEVDIAKHVSVVGMPSSEKNDGDCSYEEE